MKKGIYQHFKGGKYEVIGTAKHSETLEDMVIYKHLPNNGELWVRPAAMFNEEVKLDGKKIKRFILLEEK